MELKQANNHKKPLFALSQKLDYKSNFWGDEQT